MRETGFLSQFQHVARKFPEPDGTGNFFAGTGNFLVGTGNSFSLSGFMESTRDGHDEMDESATIARHWLPQSSDAARVACFNPCLSG
jgi:hypothetical protein